MRNLKANVVLIAALHVAAVLPAAELPVLNAANGFGKITCVSKASAKLEDGVLKIFDMAFDYEMYFGVHPFFTAEVDSIDIRYRAFDMEADRFSGQLYYAPGSEEYSGGRCWNIPHLEADGEWHTLHLTEKNLPDPGDWRGCGILSRFRLDMTDAPGGRIEISEIAFRRKDGGKPSAERATVSPELASALEGDAWPAVKPETFGKTPLENARAVSVTCKGAAVLPQKAKAGETVRLAVYFDGDVPDFPARVDVSLLTDDTLRWSEGVWVGREAFHRIGGMSWRLDFPYRLPVCLDSGRMTVRATSPSIHCVAGRLPDASLQFERVESIPGSEKPVSACVRRVAGSPQFFVDGKPFYALSGLTFQPVRHSFAPLNLVTVRGGKNWWPKLDEFDPSAFDLAAERNMRLYPDAYFMFDLVICPPSDWAAVNPGDVAVDEQGRCGNDRGVTFSFASKTVLDDMEKMVERAISYLENSPYANRIIGYRINSGHTIEWLGWTATKGSFMDFSPVAAKGFADYLHEFYPKVAEVSVPSPAERKALDAPWSVVWDFGKHIRPIAYNDFYSRCVADGMLRMCRRAKGILGGRKLVGTYFGYVMTLMEVGNNHMRGHFATKRVLDGATGAVDFLMSPQGYCYGHRGLGDPLVDMKPFASIADHGIVPMIEDDTRTHNMRPLGPGVQTRTEEQTVGVMRRNMGISICRNQPFYTYALCQGTEFDFPQFAADSAALRQIGEHVLASGGARRNAEIAVVVSEEAIKAMPDLADAKKEKFAHGEQNYRPDGNVDRRTTVAAAPVVKDVFGKLYTRLSRIGAPVDYRLAEDLADNHGDHRLYIFPLCLKYDPAIAKAAAALREKDCTIVWAYAPGCVSQDGDSLSAMKSLTGLDFAAAARQDATVTLADGTETGKTGHEVAPLFKVVSQGETLGKYESGEPGFVAVRTGKAESVFFGSYRMELPVLRMLAKRAGVHIYTESTDPMEANEKFFSLHARIAGKKTVKLPRRTSVYDVFNGRLVAIDADEFSFDAPLFSSWLFYCADDAEAFSHNLGVIQKTGRAHCPQCAAAACGHAALPNRNSLAHDNF